MFDRIRIYCTLFLSFSPTFLLAQDTIAYKMETFGSLSSGDYTPFWMTSNTFGMVPLKTDNGYLRTSACWNHSFSKKWKLKAGVDLIGVFNHSSSIWVHQLYADISFQKIKLSIGSKERYSSMLDRELSSGDMNFSTNARSIPEANLSIPEYMTVPFTNEILKFKADFAVGKSFDNDYILDTKPTNANYAKDILWHHKSLFFQLNDPECQFPVFLVLGLEHAVQWGGWTTYQNFGKIPHSFKDFLKVISGKSGGEGTVDGDQMNVLGNHQGTYNLKLGYKSKSFIASVYKQHYFDDNSGMEYANWRDGIWGVEITSLQQTYLKKIVLEYIQTTNQSGPMHFLGYDGSRNVRGGGNDDYYNHDFYYQGWSYFGRAIGNPLLTSPEYNQDNTLHFKNNRVKAIHLGLEGNVSSEISYRTLLTSMQSWGRMSAPFLKRKDNFSALLECNYNSPKWRFGLQLAVDHGDIYNNNWGVSLKIARINSFSF